jgi:hypothetical protein
MKIRSVVFELLKTNGHGPTDIVKLIDFFQLSLQSLQKQILGEKVKGVKRMFKLY